MNTTLNPKLCQHIIGDNAWRMAAWLATQLPDTYRVLSANELAFDYILAMNPGRAISSPTRRTPGFQETKGMPTLLLLNHTSVEETVAYHEGISTEKDIVYSIQQGDVVDDMPGIRVLDSDIVLMQNLHFYGEKFCKFFNDLREYFGLDNQSLQAAMVSNADEYKRAQSLGNVVWTYSEAKPDYVTDIPILKLRDGHVV